MQVEKDDFFFTRLRSTSPLKQHKILVKEHVHETFTAFAVSRQDLFQEEGAVALTLQCIDKMGAYGDALNFAEEYGEEAGCSWEGLLNNLYVLLAATVRGNRANCAKFAKHLDWLINQLEAQTVTTGEFTGLHLFAWFLLKS